MYQRRGHGDEDDRYSAGIRTNIDKYNVRPIVSYCTVLYVRAPCDVSFRATSFRVVGSYKTCDSK